jgi:hypothetical protein
MATVAIASARQRQASRQMSRTFQTGMFGSDGRSDAGGGETVT